MFTLTECSELIDLHLHKYVFLLVDQAKFIHIQWGKKVFSQPPIVQVLPLKKMREACDFHHRYTSTMRDKIRKKNPENHIVGFIKNLFANYGGKQVFGHLQTSKIAGSHRPVTSSLRGSSVLHSLPVLMASV